MEAKGTSELFQRLRHPAEDVWGQASESLGLVACRSASIRRRLLSLARSPVPAWRLRTIPALAALAAAHGPALEALTELLGDPDTRARLQAAKSLGTAAAGGCKATWRLLLACSESTDDAVRRGSAEGLGLCAGRNREARERLREMLDDEHSQVRSAAVAAAVRSCAGKPGFRAALDSIASIAANDEHVCNALAQALFELAQQRPGIARSSAAKFAESKSERLRWCAAAAVAALPAGKSIALQLIADESPVVRTGLAHSIRMAKPEWGEAIVLRMADSSDRQVAAAAVEALASYPSRESLEAALRAARARSQMLRAAAAQALAAIVAAEGNSNAEAALRNLAADARLFVRQATATALGSVSGPHGEWACAQVAGLAQDSSSAVRAASAHSAASLGMEQVLLRLAGDRSPGVRAVAAAGLGSLPAGPRLLSALADMLADRSARQSAALSLAGIVERQPRLLPRIMEIVLSRPGASEAVASLANACCDPELCAALEAWVEALASDDMGAAAALAAERFASSQQDFCQDFARFWKTLARLCSTSTLREIGEMGKVLPRAYSSPLLSESGAASEAWAALSAAAAASARAARSDLPAQRAEALAEAARALDEAEGAGGLPEFTAGFIGSVARAWRVVVSASQQDIAGQADVSARLISQAILRKPLVDVAVLVSNHGPAPACDVRVWFGSGPGLTPAEPDCEVGDLPSGIASQAQVKMRCASGSESAQVRGTISWSDVKERRRSFTFPVALRSARRFRPLPNPYLPGKPLAADSPMFFGRADTFEQLRQSISAAHQCNVVGLIGQRRSGKTSIALRLERELGDSYLPVVLDMQGVLGETLPGLRYQVALRTSRALAREGLVADMPDPAKAEKQSFLVEHLACAAERAGQRKLLVVMDEFADVQQSVEAGLLPKTTFHNLRNTLQHSPQIGFILCGTHRIEDLRPDHWGPLFNLAVYCHLGPLDDASARALATKPMEQAGVIVEDLATEKILRLCGGQPYLIQLAGHYLIAEMNERRSAALSASAVDDALPKLRRWAQGHLRYLQQLAAAEEQATLRALAARGPWAEYASAAELAALLPEIGREGLVRALSGLAEKGIAQATGGAEPWWHLHVGLLAK